MRALPKNLQLETFNLQLINTMAIGNEFGGADGEHDLSYGIASDAQAAEERAHRRHARQIDEPCLVRRLAVDHGINEATMTEIIGDIEEAKGNSENIAIATQYRAMKDWMNDALHMMRRTMNNQLKDAMTSPLDLLRAFDTACLAMGFTDVCDATEAAELARKYGVPKETVNKPKLEFQKKVQMPPAPGQRTEQQREGFAAKRVEKIKERQGQGTN